MYQIHSSISSSTASWEPPAKRITGLFYPRSASVGFSGPPWGSLGLRQPACQPPSQPASQPVHDRFPGRNSASQPASQPAPCLVVILLVGRLPGRNFGCGEAPWSEFSLWETCLVVHTYKHNSACWETLVLKWISCWNSTYIHTYIVVHSTWGLPLGLHKNSVASLSGRKSAGGEPPASQPSA